MDDGRYGSVAKDGHGLIRRSARRDPSVLRSGSEEDLDSFCVVSVAVVELKQGRQRFGPCGEGAKCVEEVQMRVDPCFEEVIAFVSAGNSSYNVMGIYM